MGTLITDNEPTSSGGDVVSYAIDPTLPRGLTLDLSTGVISGTPSELSTTPIEYTITATNSGGSDTFVVTITVNAGASLFTFICFCSSQSNTCAHSLLLC